MTQQSTVAGLRILENQPLSLFTTWRVGGPADYLVRAANRESVIEALRWAKERDLPVTVIGGGSNLLVGDGGIRGLVVAARTPGERADSLVTVSDLGDRVRLRAAAQVPLSWLGRFAAERGWGGLDWAVGLPGTVGGATVNNAGAHGTELKDHLEMMTLLSTEGEVEEYGHDWLAATYRMTRLKGSTRPRPWIVLDSTFILPKADSATLVRLADEHAQFRKDTQPTGACAGSTFANPPHDYAGRLLEAAGLKGFAIGGARFSTKHSNWIVNGGGATAHDIRALIAHARVTVREHFGIALRAEIEEVGEP